MRVGDSALRFLPAMTSTRFGVGRHLDRAGRRVFRAGIGRRGTASLHRYFADARRTDAWPSIEHTLEQLADRPVATVFGARNDPLRFQPEWRRRFPAARQLVVPHGNHFPMCDSPARVADAVRGLSTAVG
jgi:pimeloyl-ACP methyl ester carboxylesterase